MGNCFGKPSSTPSSQPARKVNANNFAGSGRTLGGSSAQPSNPPVANSSTPASTTAPSQNYGSILGGIGNGGRVGGDPKSAAAQAAEARAAKAAQTGSGALEQKLAAQRKGNALQQAAAENLRTREIDQAAEARQWS